MTQEEKAKAYDEVREKIAIRFGSNVADEIFSQFEMSEDERIRKALLGYIKGVSEREVCKETLNEWIAWLEKQGEQKPADTKEYDFHGMKFVPKFAKGDIIKDKKRSEVSIIKDFSYDTGLYTHTYGQFPITIQDNYEIIEQKPVWSEEDETKIKSIIALLKSPALCTMDGNKGIINESIKYLKSLKDRILPQPKQEWSEEEIENCAREAEDNNCIILAKHIRKLKSIRTQSTWKPSDEQMNVLLSEVTFLPKGCHKQIVLESLYQDLKKLRG